MELNEICWAASVSNPDDHWHEDLLTVWENEKDPTHGGEGGSSLSYHYPGEEGELKCSPSLRSTGTRMLIRSSSEAPEPQ